MHASHRNKVQLIHEQIVTALAPGGLLSEAVDEAERRGVRSLREHEKLTDLELLTAQQRATAFEVRSKQNLLVFRIGNAMRVQRRLPTCMEE